MIFLKRKTPGLLRRRAAWLLGGIFLLNVTALFMVVYPGVVAFHYLLYLACTMGLLIAVILAEVWVMAAQNAVEPTRRTQGLMAAGLCLCCLVPQVISRLANPNPMLGALTGTETLSPVEGAFPANPAQHRMVASRLISRIVKKGGLMAQWGYTPKIFLETETSVTGQVLAAYWAIPDTPLREYFRKRFLDALKADSPVVFVDTVGPFRFHFTDRSRQGYETFPLLRDYVDRNYELSADVDGIRIFIRKDSISLKTASGFAAIHDQNYAIALADFESALQLEPNNAEAIANHGIALFLFSRMTEGLAEIDRALMADPDLNDIRVMRSRFHRQLGDIRGALADVREALRRAPADWLNRPMAEQLERELSGLAAPR